MLGDTLPSRTRSRLRRTIKACRTSDKISEFVAYAIESDFGIYCWCCQIRLRNLSFIQSNPILGFIVEKSDFRIYTIKSDFRIYNRLYNQIRIKPSQHEKNGRTSSVSREARGAYYIYIYTHTYMYMY